MIHDYRDYRDIFSLIRRPTLSINNHPSNISAPAMCLSYGLGSGTNGRTISEINCANRNGMRNCSNLGVLTCSQCALVKYCSGRCQRRHWSRHRSYCEHAYMNQGWEPEWVARNRKPMLSSSRFTPSSTSSEVYKNSGGPAYDCLNLLDNEGLENIPKNIRICMTSAGDLRNLIRTVNNLPSGHDGKVSILLNSSNAIVLNRMLVILCVLLNSGPTPEESAELATHLMCSARLPRIGASYIRYCANLIYEEHNRGGDMVFQAAIKTRGRGKLYSAQPAASVKRALEMISSDYSLSKAMASMTSVFQDPFHLDDRDKLLSNLNPSHRLALYKFWETGVLAPFSMDLEAFKSPNRLMFSPQGEWMGTASGVNPLHGWDVAAVRCSGLESGCDPAGDILGCLFFHVKAELKEFIGRMTECDIAISLLQYDSRLLSKGLSIGVLPEFAGASFDRVDIGDASDQYNLAEYLEDWAPLLNKESDKSCIIMHSKKWHEESPASIARDNPRALKILTERCRRVSKIKTKLKPLFNGSKTPFSARLLSSLDAFVDHERAFMQYLENQGAQSIRSNLGIGLRPVNFVHPKRFGVPLHLDWQKLPNLNKEEFYDLFIIGGADLTIRFAEFEITKTD